jgi:hypothetical protein
MLKNYIKKETESKRVQVPNLFINSQNKKMLDTIHKYIQHHQKHIQSTNNKKEHHSNQTIIIISNLFINALKNNYKINNTD